MRNKIIFTIVISLIVIVPLAQASLIENVWYNTLSFLGIIKITNANHLNSDRIVISDIYNEVKALDDIWSKTIPDGDYVRVTFEKALTKENDITIYPRIVSGNPIIEVYEKNNDEIIAEFTSVNSNEYNTIFLTNLQKPEKTFDLKIIGGSVEFDHIIDPFPQFIGAGTPVSGLAASNNITVTCPSYVANDILIISGFFTDADTDTIVMEGTEWNSIAQIQDGTHDAGWWWKRAAGSDTVGANLLTADDDIYAICYVIRYANITGTPYDAGFATVANLTTAVDDTTPYTATVDTLDTNRVVVSFFSGNDDTAWSTSPPPATWTLESDVSVTDSGTDAQFTVISKNISGASSVPREQIGIRSGIEMGASLTIAFILTPDVTKPTISALNVNDATITEADVGVDKFIATIDFDEPMNTGVAATVAFDPAVATTLTNCGGVWTDADTYTYTCDVEDANVTQADVDIDVSNAQDVATNVMLADTTSGVDKFSISTASTCGYTSGHWAVDCADACEITSPVAVDSGYNITLSGAGVFKVTGTDISGFSHILVKDGCSILEKDGGRLLGYG